MQPSMRLADEPNPGAIWHNYFLLRPLIRWQQPMEMVIDCARI
jgi:hypothetical protein